MEIAVFLLFFLFSLTEAQFATGASTLQFAPALRASFLRGRLTPTICSSNLRQHFAPVFCAVAGPGADTPNTATNKPETVRARNEVWNRKGLKDAKWWAMGAGPVTTKEIRLTYGIVNVAMDLLDKAKAQRDMLMYKAAEMKRRGVYRTVQKNYTSSKDGTTFVGVRDEMETMEAVWKRAAIAWTAVGESLEKVVDQSEDFTSEKPRVIAVASRATADAAFAAADAFLQEMMSGDPDNDRQAAIGRKALPGIAEKMDEDPATAAGELFEMGAAWADTARDWNKAANEIRRTTDRGREDDPYAQDFGFRPMQTEYDNPMLNDPNSLMQTSPSVIIPAAMLISLVMGIGFAFTKCEFCHGASKVADERLLIVCS